MVSPLSGLLRDWFAGAKPAPPTAARRVAGRTPAIMWPHKKPGLVPVFLCLLITAQYYYSLGAWGLGLGAWGLGLGAWGLGLGAWGLGLGAWSMGLGGWGLGVGGWSLVVGFWCLVSVGCQPFVFFIPCQ